ncbi:CHAT domain-containing protein [Favolaschia claudopus]|uniref:CHAT domain-containing protein n=1 Tax=Favolaschia claudopus TaxID=2862362 RepID=A0AAV9Z7X0_9AGAR
MSELHTVITLDELNIESLIYPHEDLPDGMKMFAQLIIEKTIWLQTLAVESEPDGRSWNVKIECKIPSQVCAFQLAFLRQSKIDGIRLLGYGQIQRSIILGPKRGKIALRLSAAFTVSQSQYHNMPICNILGSNTSSVASVDLDTVHDNLEKELAVTNPLGIWLMHERVLLHLKEGKGRAELLNSLGDLGLALLNRVKQLGRPEDNTKAINILQQGVNLTSDEDPQKPSWLGNLGLAYKNRFEQVGDIADVNQAIKYYQAAVDLTPDGHMNKPPHLSNLGVALLNRFEQLGDVTDLNHSITCQQAAVDLVPDDNRDKPAQLTNLGSALTMRFRQLGDVADLNQAITHHQSSVDLAPDGHKDKSAQLNNLAIALRNRFGQLGDLADLNQAITHHKSGIDLAPDGHKDKPAQLSNLAFALCDRFEQLGDLADLDHAITYFQTAVGLSPEGHVDKPGWLSNLGYALCNRFEQLGDLADLSHSIACQQAANNLTPEGHVNKAGGLSNLSTALSNRFKRLGDLADLSHSITCQQAAVDLTPDGHTDKPGRLSDLGNVFLFRFEQLGDLADLSHSITCQQAAVDLTPDGHMKKAIWLSNLGTALSNRFKRLGDLADLNQATTYFQAAVDLTPDDHPNKPRHLNNLGHSFLLRNDLSTMTEDCEKILHCNILAACSPSGPARVRFNAAGIWAEYAHKHRPASVLVAYTTAISLLPELAWLGLSISDRHYRLLHAGLVVRDAAATVIAAGDAQKAVEWLEQGRSIVWGQILGLRTPVDELKQAHPKLAEQFISLSKTLETTGITTSSTIKYTTSQPTNIDSENFHGIALQRSKLVDQIRQQTGFEQFLLPKSISHLSCAAESGPVVILNISKYGCDGLVLLPDLEGEVIHVPLKDFTLAKAQFLADLLASTVGRSGRSERLKGCHEANLPSTELIALILSELWTNLVKPILNAMAINNPTQNPERIWWCPTGPLAFLPIHAAGSYGKGQPFGSKLSDYVISSYTPSLSALIEGHRQRLESQTELQLLALSQPSATGQSHIPGTQEEVKYIQEQAIGKLDIICLDGQSATPDNHSTPTESALLLAGSSQLTLSDIIQLELSNADLAFLSACETATGSSELQDEAVHLTAGMLLAGYGSVIGTMWTIQDNDAPQVARDVYAHLLQTSPPDPRQSAKALHIAVQNLQKQGKSFLQWVPFVHFGV